MTVREIENAEIERTVEDLCIKANTVLRGDVLEALKAACEKEEDGSLVKKMLGILLANAKIAEEEAMPLCQDTGVAAVFIDIGRDVILTDGDMINAINRGVENAYRKGFFRKSVVEDPIIRNNTGTNTPAVIHIGVTDKSGLTVSVMPKGFGSENKSRLIMLNPTCEPDKIVDFCVETVKIAGPDACPPYVLGIGIGGTMESCAYMAKKALLRPINISNPKPHIAELERSILEQANALKIGVMGLGGATTVMGVNIEVGPTHIAGLPLAVNLSCHALRSASTVI